MQPHLLGPAAGRKCGINSLGSRPSQRHTAALPRLLFGPSGQSLCLYRWPWRRRRPPEATCSSSEASSPLPLTYLYAVPSPWRCCAPGGTHLSRPSGSLPSAPWRPIPAKATARSSRPASRRCSSSFVRPRRGLPPLGTSPFQRLPLVRNQTKKTNKFNDCLLV